MTNGISQLEKDLQFIDKADRLTKQGIEFIAYFIGLVSCLAVHILYFAMFAINGIKVMMYFNIFSVLFYVVAIVLVKLVKEKLTLVYWSLAEIIVHAFVATWCIGLRADFIMFLLMIIPIAFLIPNKNKAIPFVIMIVSVFLYGYAHLNFQDPGRLLYNVQSRTLEHWFYVINIIIGAFVMNYVTAIYTVLNVYTESKLRTQHEQLRIMAYVDPLTRLSNRRAIWDDLKRIYSESRESGKNYVIGLGDIDHFKKVNDTYGHDRGDEVLTAVAEMIKEKIPEGGSVARWGGEEFLFVLPAAGVQEGSNCAEQILKTLREYRFSDGEKEFFVTMTFGICEGAKDENLEQIISRADQRLYKGKNNGRDHVEYTD